MSDRYTIAAELVYGPSAVPEWLAGSVLWPPVKWRPGIRSALTPNWSSLGVPVLVCPECGEPVAACNPKVWTVANGPFPQWAHAVDGEPLCPVMTSTGYTPAPFPVPQPMFSELSSSADLPAVEGGENT
jgi:hypothetical protein